MRNRILGVTISILCLCTSLGSATDFVFRTVDVPFPDTTNTTVTGLNRSGDAVGAYLDAGGQDQGFLRQGRAWQTLLNVMPEGLNRSGAVTGLWLQTHLQGCVFQDGTFRPLNVPFRPGGPVTLFTEALAINDAGVTVGDFRTEDGPFHGFIATSNGAALVPHLGHGMPGVTMLDCAPGSKRWACRH
jgi:hypothetical protein